MLGKLKLQLEMKKIDERKRKDRQYSKTNKQKNPLHIHVRLDYALDSCGEMTARRCKAACGRGENTLCHFLQGM